MQGGFFSQEEVAMMSAGLCPPAPKDYVLPTRFPSLRGAARIAWDWETKDPKLMEYGNGVYRKDGFIVGGSIAAWDRDNKLIHAEYYPMRHRNGPNLQPEKVMAYFADQLNFFEGELTGANLLYEGDWGQANGITPVYAKWRDIQWAEAILDEMAYNYKLETIAQKYFGQGKFTNHFQLMYGPDYIKRFDEVHPGHARVYGVGDVLLPNAILNQQYKALEALGLRDLFELESRLTPFLLYLRRQGVRMDMDAAGRYREELTAKMVDKIAQLKAKTGLPFSLENFNNKKFLAWAFDRMGIKAPKSAKGDLSVTDKFLHHLCKCKVPDKKDPKKMVDNQDCGCPGRLLETCNKYNKVISTFINGYVFDYAIDGRVHGEFHPLRKADENSENGTETGRFSGSNPNLQNLPARDPELGPMCRSMFIPEEGAEWWSADYSQIEYRYLAHMASIMPVIKGQGEAAERRRKSLESVQATIAKYIQQPDTDFHQALADLVSVALGTVFPRGQAKNLNFGLVYGMGLEKLARDLNMLDKDGKPTQECKDLMATYHNAAPFVKDLYDLCIETAANTGEIRTILNRRRQFDFWEPRRRAKGVEYKSLPLEQAINAYGFDIVRCETHKALNTLLQGSAADEMKMAMVKAWEAGIFSSTKDFTCSLTIHDELDGSMFPTARGLECYRELCNLMENAIPLNLPVLVGKGNEKKEKDGRITIIHPRNWSEAK